MKALAIATQILAFAESNAPGPAPGMSASPGPGPAPLHVEQTVQTKQVFQNEVAEHFEEEMKDGEYDKPTPVILGWEVEFEIKNYNYFDLNKALVTSDDDNVAPPEKKTESALAKPEEVVEKEPRFWSKAALGKSFRKTFKQAGDTPEKLDDASREGFYPIVNVGPSEEEHQEELKRHQEHYKRTGEGPGGGAGPTEIGRMPTQEEARNMQPGVIYEDTSTEDDDVDDDTGAVQSSLSKTADQFQEFSESGGAGHDANGTVHPGGSFIQTKLKAALGRCLTEKGMFADTCVVDVLRDAVKGSFVDLVETILDTPEERQELLDWFLHRQSDKHEDLGLAPAPGPAFMQVRKHDLRSGLLARQHAAGPAPVAAAASAPVAAGAFGPGAGAPAPGHPVLEKSMQPKPPGSPEPMDSAMNGKPAPPVAAVEQIPGAPPAPAAGPPQWKADVFVQFYPGEERPVVEDGEVGRSTIVKVWLRGAPNTRVFELAPWIEAVLKRHEEDGLLEMLLEKRLFDATGIAPKISGITDIRLDSKQQWSLDTCESHMHKIMQQFSMAYTRRMVPTAIYNECTNFVSEVSFSHDRLFDFHDRIKCRHATVKLSKEWNFGKGKTTTSPPFAAPAPAAMLAPGAAIAPVTSGPSKPAIDLRGFCADVCEIKYGTDAPTCHVTEGKNLHDAAP